MSQTDGCEARSGGVVISQADLEEHIRRDGSGCWLWTRNVDSAGYGRLFVGRRRSLRAHRAVWVAYGGMFLPGRWHLDHLCRVRHCVNPAHLRPVTPRENTLAPGSEAPSKKNTEKTHCRCGREFTPEPLRPGRRWCEPCCTVRDRKYEKAHREAARARGAKYKASHRKELRASARAARVRDPEKHRTADRQSYQRNKQARSRRNVAYHKAHREEILARKRQRYQEAKRAG